MMFNLAMAHKFASIGAGYWVMPILLLALGVAMIVKPDLFASMPFRILGWALIVYDRIQAAQQAAAKAEIEDAVIVEDNLPSTNT